MDWAEPETITVADELREFVGGHPLVAELLVRRGITTVEAARAFLDPDAYTPVPAEELPDMEAAVARVEAALQRGERICVWGDFDVDGQTATTLLVSVLRDLGGDVIHHIPVRATESHGIRTPWLQEELDRGARLLLTCDTGVSEHEALAYAQARGVDVVVTDHHELPAELPAAHAVVNPHRLPAEHPLATLPGVGVAYKLAELLYRRAGRPEAAAALLDLVALGVVADVAVQRGDTRYLLQRGLEVLRRTPRLGLQELLKNAQILPEHLNEEHIGFGIAPRLNALGRLSDANSIVEFFTTTDLSQARIMASQLESLNERRKTDTERIFREAQAQIEHDPSLLEFAALVLDRPGWHPGVIGIVANRLVEAYTRPVVLIATPDADVGRGSARSVPGCHLTEAIATQAHLLEGYGGHEMAAGLAIAPDNIAAFRRGLSEAVAAQLEGVAPPATAIDGYVPLSALSLELVRELERLAPFGAGNPAPLLATRDVRLVAQRQLGRERRHLLLTVAPADAGEGAGDAPAAERNVIWWQWQGAPVPQGRFDLAYTVRANDFQGTLRLQIVWQDARLLEPAVEAVPEAPALEVLDYRDVPAPEEEVARWRARGALVWGEGPAARAVAAVSRAALREAETLALWTPPPSTEVLLAAVTRVSPTQVLLFAPPQPLEEATAFLRYLGGLVKHVLRAREGTVTLAELAAATGHRESTVQRGLAWLAARGHVRIMREEAGSVWLSPPAPGARVAADVAQRALAEVRALLKETAAYRRYLAHIDPDRLALWLAEALT